MMFPRPDNLGLDMKAPVKDFYPGQESWSFIQNSWLTFRLDLVKRSQNFNLILGLWPM